MNFRLVLAVVFCVVACVTSNAVAQSWPDPSVSDYEITQVRGGLYRVRAGRQHTVFVVAPEGIILVDSLNRSVAAWLTKELAVRFPGVPVKYVVVTHHDAERASGSGLFVNAQRVGQERFNDELRRSQRSDPSTYGRVSGIELRYDDRRAIALGRAVVELIHTEFGHAPEMSLVYFPDERVVFGAGVPSVASNPFAFGSFKPGEVLAWTKVVSALDFDTLLTGEGAVVSRAEVLALNAYLEKLIETVADGYESGRGVSHVQRSLQRTRTSDPYDVAVQDAHIAEVYRNMRLARMEIFGGGVMRLTTANRAYCRNYTTCDAGGQLALGNAGITLSRGSFGITTEMTWGQQIVSSRGAMFYAEESARRDVRVSGLVRYAPSPRAVSVALLAGMSIGVVDERGMARARLASAGGAGPYPIELRYFEAGVTGGVDVIARMPSGFSVVLPIRVTRALPWREISEIAASPLEFQAGVGLSMRIARRVR